MNLKVSPYIALLCRYFLFWVLFFQMARISFMLYHFNRYSPFSIKDIANTFLHGFRLDLAMAAYFSVIPFLFITIYTLFKKRAILKVLHLYSYLLIVACTVNIIFDAALYSEWGVKINNDALQLLINSFKEVSASAESSPWFKITCFMLALFSSSIYLYMKIVVKPIRQYKHQFVFPIISTIAYLFFINGLLLLGIRGGIQLIPINISYAYFSEQPLLNHAAVNTIWNFSKSVLNAYETPVNRYSHFTKEMIKSFARDIKSDTNDTTKLFTTARPNVVLILLESFTADVIKQLNGLPDVAPFMNEMIDSSYLFSRCYASGDRTYKGLPAVLSGLPSLPNITMLQYPDKMSKIPCMAHQFNEIGYQTLFYYGGDLEFANMKSYIIGCNFNKTISKSEFSSNDCNSKWGAHDHIVLNRFLTDLNSTKPPFFASLLTLSNHEPFEIPIPARFVAKDKSDEEATLFKNTAFYTDKSIQDFMNSAKKTTWYDNTIFLFIADHGHRLPLNHNDIYLPQRFHIPFWIYGKPLKKEYRGQKFEKVMSQNDLASILFTQLNISDEKYLWSKNAINPSQHDFAFYTYNDGIAWIDRDSMIAVYDNLSKKQVYGIQDTLATNKAKMYLQYLYETVFE